MTQAPNLILLTDDEMKKAVASLNSEKAPDVYGVSAEHIYYGGPAGMNCVQTLINNIPFNTEIPSSMKLGILNRRIKETVKIFITIIV